MTYVKTDWNDDASPPINEANLDKIEQGIEDAHTNAAAAQTTADAAIAKSILDAAGDLVSASAGDTPARLALGSNDEVLSVNTGALDYRKVVNAMVDAAAAIDYAKLNLALSIVNADIAVAAAIAYSKLNLASSIVNADISASAAIAYAKLNLALSIVNADINASAAIDYSKLNLTNNIVNADIDDAAAIDFSKLAATAWDTYAPVLTASTSNPTLGTGSSQIGRFMQIGKLVVATVVITFGSSGTDAGSGTYIVSLPVTAKIPAVANLSIGSGNVTEAAVDNDIVNPFVDSVTGDSCQMVVEGGNVVAHNVPFAWGANDRIQLSVFYEAV